MCCLENRLREVNFLAQVTQLMSAGAKTGSEAVTVLSAAPCVASSCCRPFWRMGTLGREGTQALPAAPAWHGRETGTHGRLWALPLTEPLGLAAPWTSSVPPSYIQPSPWAALGQPCSLDSDGKGLTPPLGTRERWCLWGGRDEDWRCRAGEHGVGGPVGEWRLPPRKLGWKPEAAVSFA